MPVVTEELQLPVREARAGEPSAWEALLARYRLPLQLMPLPVNTPVNSFRSFL